GVFSHERGHDHTLERRAVDAIHDQREAALGDERQRHPEADEDHLHGAASPRRRGRSPDCAGSTSAEGGHRSATSMLSASQSTACTGGPSAPRTRTPLIVPPRTAPRRSPSRVTCSIPSAISGAPGRGSSAKLTERSAIVRSSGGG